MRPHALTTALGVALSAVALAACGGSSDSTEDSGDSSASSSGNGAKLSLVAYAVPKPGFDKLIPAFQKTDAGKGVTFAQSYGASGDQSRKVEAGLQTDVVNFSVEPDVTRLVKAGIVDEDWNQDAHKGLAFGSVVTIVTRAGNPKGIKDWDDIIKPGVEVVTPNPFSSGSAKWNLLAPYAVKSDGGKDEAAGLAYIDTLVSEHVKVQPKSGREATETFLQGTGDVLLTYENEALFIKGEGEKVDYVTPPGTFKIENPVAVLNNSKHPEQAEAFKEFLYSDEGQKLWAEAGFRPVNEEILAEYADKFPDPEKLWTIADLGGWPDVDEKFFDPDNGSIAKIYDKATG
ncbi:MAG: sulfate ABC transporter substrate-binding protein [Solirubrobacteraceae bacterium]|nr:sulfate ABC transporter substrate-binding protein [Solirubrobacteraceae bacterium]